MPRKTKAKPPDGLTNEQVAERYKDFCIKHGKDFSESVWSDIWNGMVIALGRADLATEEHYQEIAFPIELAFVDNGDADADE